MEFENMPDIPEQSPEPQPECRRPAKKGFDKKYIFYGLIAVFATIFVICAVVVGDYIIESIQNNALYESMQNQYNAAGNETVAPNADGNYVVTDPNTGEDIVLPTSPQQKPMLQKMAQIYALNQHTVGWIKIDGTRVNYPVLQTPNTPQWRDYYLYRNFEGKDSDHGSLYIREACNVFKPSDNLVIYGHNMNDRSMFGDLFQYGGKSYWEGHKYIQFDTLYEQHTYEIFAVFRTSGTQGEGFAYHVFKDAKNQAEYDAFIAECKALSLYDTGITPVYGEKLITLSTCDFHIDNGRLVVVARMVA